MFRVPLGATQKKRAPLAVQTLIGIWIKVSDRVRHRLGPFFSLTGGLAGATTSAEEFRYSIANGACHDRRRH